MQFEKNHLYHIYNQGNNRQRIFFTDENYLFFLKKLKTHICPFADIVAWCLMPNHFHLMVKVNEVMLTTEGFALSETLGTQSGTFSIQSEALGNKTKTINHSIGVMLRSYTNAINKQENRTGALFRKATKAECLDEISGITPSFYNGQFGTTMHIDNPEKRYPLVCFNYIHQNPVNAKLVKKAEEWPYSSYCDVVGLRNGILINRKLIKALELKSECDFKSRPD